MIFIQRHLFFFVFLLTSCQSNSIISSTSTSDNTPFYIDRNFGDYNNDFEQVTTAYRLIAEKIIPDIVYANLYTGKEEIVEVVEDSQNGKKYHVRNETLDLWVSKERLTFIYPKSEELLDLLTTDECELYVNYTSFSSKSDFFVWVDIKRQIVQVFQQKNNFFFLIRRIPCATGKTTTPSKRGIFYLQDKGSVFYNYEKYYKCYYWSKYSGNYLLHSIPYSLEGNPLNTTLQKKVTHGCIRMSYSDAKWFYEFVPLNTTIFVN